MFIYVSGPYSADEAEKLEKNIFLADEAGRSLLKKGHTPFVPHTMMKSWEQRGIPREDVLKVCRSWLERCDALLHLGSSVGADTELRRAEELGLRIFRTLDEVPQSEDIEMEGWSEQKVTAYLTEYEQCQESYRHTYQTIWQAGAIFVAVSAGIVALWDKSKGFSPWMIILAPLPFLFWYVGIFRPMNKYGELRRGILRDIERTLNKLIPGLSLKHFSEYYDYGVEMRVQFRKRFKGKNPLRWFGALAGLPVSYVVNALGVMVGLFWLVYVVGHSLGYF